MAKRIRIELYNAPGSLLDHAIIPANEDGTEQSGAIYDVLGEWTLGPGDTIKIVEVE